MREVVLDTETTGLDPRSGHRIVEIGCVELINHMATGKHFHKYLNPERDIPDRSCVPGVADPDRGRAPTGGAPRPGRGHDRAGRRRA